MNLFYLDEDPSECAKAHYDKHVRKMILESAQLLSTTHRVLNGVETIKLDRIGRKRKTWIFNDERENLFYKSTHVNHPVAIWCRKSSENYKFLYDLYIELCKEYEYRFNKKHASEKLKKQLKELPSNIPKDTFTTPAIATDENNKFCKDAIICYRSYYATTKKHLMEYTKRDKPNWL